MKDMQVASMRTSAAPEPQALPVLQASAATLWNKALAYHQAGWLSEAEELYGKLLQQCPEHFDGLHMLGVIAHQRGEHAAALRRIDHALTIDPGAAQAHNNRGVVLAELKRLEEALASYNTAIALAPGYVDAIVNRANALRELNRFEQALASCDRAIALRPDLAEAFNSRGSALQNLMRMDEALASFDRAVAIDPDYAEGYWYRALCRLRLGRYSEGWVDYEWRWRTDQTDSERRNFSQPLWFGDGDIAGKTLLLHPEQGFGDTVMAVRYIPKVIERGARVVLETPSALEPLLAGIEGIAQVVTKGSPLPAFDLHCPLLSLPLAFGTTLDAIPAQVPYLSVPANYFEKWQQRLPGFGKIRVGICWAGNPDHKRDHQRSIALDLMLPLLSRSDVSFISLQKPLRERDVAILRNNPQIAHFDNDIENFADTAAIISMLDLVISVDTSVVHLAGALGRPVWILLQFMPDWRWLLDRNDSPWYPTARLFRQSRSDDWDGVVDAATSELSRFVASNATQFPDHVRHD